MNSKFILLEKECEYEIIPEKLEKYKLEGKKPKIDRVCKTTYVIPEEKEGYKILGEFDLPYRLNKDDIFIMDDEFEFKVESIKFNKNCIKYYMSVLSKESKNKYIKISRQISDYIDYDKDYRIKLITDELFKKYNITGGIGYINGNDFLIESFYENGDILKEIINKYDTIYDIRIKLLKIKDEILL